MPCHILLLTFPIAVLLPFAGLLLIRPRVLSVVRVGVFDESRHELSHVIAVTFKLPKLLLERCKVTTLLQNQDNRACRNAIQ